MSEEYLLFGGRIVDTVAGFVQDDMDVVVDGDIITDVIPGGRYASENARRIDCTGQYILPGLFECHAHLGFLAAEDESVGREIRAEVEIDDAVPSERLGEWVLGDFVRRGVTQIRDVGSPIAIIKKFAEDIGRGKYPGPDVFYAGPMLEKSPLTWEKHNEIIPDFTIPVDREADADRIVRWLTDNGVSCLKTFNKFDRRVYKRILSQAASYDLPVVHDPGSALFHDIPMDTALELGVRCFEHGKSPWPAVLTDELARELKRVKRDGSPEDKKEFETKAFERGDDSISEDKLTSLMQEMNSHEACFCPTMHVFTQFLAEQKEKNDAESLRRLTVLNDIQRRCVRAAVESGVPILTGHDGHVPSHTIAEMILLAEAGVPPVEIIRGATLYPARWLKADDRFGSVMPGMIANLLVVNGNPLEDIVNITRVHAVVCHGRRLDES